MYARWPKGSSLWLNIFRRRCFAPSCFSWVHKYIGQRILPVFPSSFFLSCSLSLFILSRLSHAAAIHTDRFILRSLSMHFAVCRLQCLSNVHMCLYICSFVYVCEKAASYTRYMICFILRGLLYIWTTWLSIQIYISMYRIFWLNGTNTRLN